MVAALLVVAIHTSPLASIDATADFLLTRVLARVAVPFFLMVSGVFALEDGRALRRFLKRTLALYTMAILLYLPLGVYAGRYACMSPLKALRLLLFDGAFYHLWYFPACMAGAVIAHALSRMRWRTGGLLVALTLYLAGLLGDSYWGMTAAAPALRRLYLRGFHLFSYTRNGLFMAPLFLLLGREIRRAAKLPKPGLCLAGALASLAAMAAEALLLRRAEWMRHDSMYLALPALCACLFAGLWQWKVPAAPRLRRLSAWVYLLHPMAIAALRLLARLVHAPWLVHCAPVYFLAVSALSLAAAGWIADVLQRPSPCGRAWIELDMDALRANVSRLRSMLPQDCALMPAVKANAYGHGAVLIARALRGMGVRAFCVATVREGVELRRHGVRGEILVLGYTHPEDFPLLRVWRLRQAVVDADYARCLNEYGRRLHVHVALDTGMHRLGLDCEDTDAIEAVFALRHLAVDGLFTHLCVSDGEDAWSRAYTQAQADAFYAAVMRLEARGVDCPKLHLLASGGVLNYPEFAEDYARAGIALYGATDGAGFQPVLSLKARVATVRRLKAGESAGYGLDFTAARETRVAVLTIGYADGVPRALSNGKIGVLLKGALAPVIGRICMDQMLVNVSAVLDVRAGDAATLIGREGEHCVRAVDWAEACDTIPNEILSRLGGRLARMMKAEAEA